MDSLNNWIMPQLSWSFRAVTPLDFDGFKLAVIEYNQDISDLIVADILAKSTGLHSVLVEFSYTVEEEDNSRPPRNIAWRNIDATIVVETDGTSLTNAELLYKLHFGIREHFQGQDRHYFEGLMRTKRDTAEGHPIYQLSMGS